MKKRQALRTIMLTPQLLEANGWEWEYPADHCNYKWYSKKDCPVSLKYYKEYGSFRYEKEVNTVGDLKDLCKIVYHHKLNIYLGFNA